MISGFRFRIISQRQKKVSQVNGGTIGVCEVNGTYQRCVEPGINGSCAHGLQKRFQIDARKLP